MRLDNLLREKIYAFVKNSDPSDSERLIVEEIFKKFNSAEQKEIRLIDNNDDYDSFFVKTDCGQFCTKISLDLQYNGLEVENNVSRSVSGTVPFMYDAGKLDSWGLNYSVQDFFDGQSLGELGKSFLTQYKESFIEAAVNLHQSNAKVPLFSDWLNQRYSKQAEFISSINFSNDIEIGEICISELSNLRKDILASFQSWMNGPHLVHGNLAPSRIILCGQTLKFINTEDSFIGSGLFDLLCLKYDFFIDENVEFQLLKLYEQKINFEQSHVYEMRHLIKKIKFYDLIMDFLKQVYVYRSVKPHKILQMTEKMSKSFINFVGLPFFDKHKDKIIDMFTKSVI